MKQMYGMSSSGNLAKAVEKITNPSALFFITSSENLEKHTLELEERFPGVPSIGGVGQSYGDTTTNENGVTVIAFSDGIAVQANVFENLSTMPVRYIKRLEDDLKKVGATPDNTVCFDLCTGHDSKIVTTFSSLLQKKKISLVGGTSNSTAVAVNGKVYEDACVYLLIKNLKGRVKIYKENIYKPMEGIRLTATNTTPEQYLINTIDGKPAEQLYRDTLHISKEAAKTQTFTNPLGRCYGTEVFLISVKDIKGQSLECYRQVNNMDILTMLELDDYKQIVKNTVDQIHEDFPKASAILSVNCLFRYLFFQQEHYWQEYLKEMCAYTTHAGMVGVGEHFDNQHVNQTMCCVVFE